MVDAGTNTSLISPPSPQVKVLELESMLDNERLRLGELRKKHYEIAGVPLDQLAEGNGETSSLVNPVTMSPKPLKPSLMKKPPLAQKPNIPPKNQFAYSVSFNLSFFFCRSLLTVGMCLIGILSDVHQLFQEKNLIECSGLKISLIKCDPLGVAGFRK